MTEAFVVLLIGSVLIVILNKMPEKEVKVEKHKKTINKFFEAFHDNDAGSKHEKKPITAKNKETGKVMSKKEILLAEADKYLEENRLNKAEEKYVEVLKIDEHDPSSYKGLGHICFIKEDYKDAEEIFEKLTKISPKDSSNYCNLGMCCYKKDNFKKARENYEKALKIERKTSYYKNLAITLTKLKKYDEALDNLLIVIDKDKKDKESFRLALSVLEDVESIKKRKKMAKILLKVEPKNPILVRLLRG